MAISAIGQASIEYNRYTHGSRYTKRHVLDFCCYHTAHSRISPIVIRTLLETSYLVPDKNAMNARGSIYPIHPHNKHNVSIAELKTGRVQVSNDAAVARQRARDAEAEAARTAGTALTAAHVPELGLVGLRTLRVYWELVN